VVAERAANGIWPAAAAGSLGPELEAAAQQVALRTSGRSICAQGPAGSLGAITGEEVTGSGARSGFRPLPASANLKPEAAGVEQDGASTLLRKSLDPLPRSLNHSRPPAAAQLDQPALESLLRRLAARKTFGPADLTAPALDRPRRRPGLLTCKQAGLFVAAAAAGAPCSAAGSSAGLRLLLATGSLCRARPAARCGSSIGLGDSAGGR